MNIPLKKFLSMLSVGLILLCMAPLLFAAGNYSYDKETTLQGILKKEIFYGPPGYGENPKSDKKEPQYLLKLEQAIKVVANPDDPLSETEESVREITLVNSSGQSLEFVIGMKILVKGKLFHAHTAHHHTQVLMEVQSLERRS